MAEKHLYECVVEARSTILVAAESQEEAEEIALRLVHSADYVVVPDDEGWQLVDETEKIEDEW